MKYLFVVILCVFCCSLNGQEIRTKAGRVFTYYDGWLSSGIINRDTVKFSKKFADIEVGEIDSIKNELFLVRSPQNDSILFRGNMIQTIGNLLNVDTANLKISGTIPNKFIQYHIYLASRKPKTEPYKGTNAYQETILMILKKYYRFKVNEDAKIVSNKSQTFYNIEFDR